jgi:hypothetical protein
MTVVGDREQAGWDGETEVLGGRASAERDVASSSTERTPDQSVVDMTHF